MEPFPSYQIDYIEKMEKPFGNWATAALRGKFYNTPPSTRV